MQRTTLKAARARFAVAAFAGVFASAGLQPRSLLAQLSYDRTTFLHGLLSSGETWTWAATPSRLGAVVSLGTQSPLTPSLNGALAVDAQRARLRSEVLNVYGGRQVLVGHSMGGLVARSALLADPSNVAAVVTVGTPHQGARVAAQRDEILRYFADLEWRVRRAMTGINWTPVLWNFGDEDVPDIVGSVRLLLADTPAIEDLRPSSPTIARLDAATTDPVPFANVYGTIPIRHAAIRVAMSAQRTDEQFDATVRLRDRFLTGLRVCRNAGYALGFGYITGSARRCGWGIRVLSNLDGRWAGYVNGWSRRRIGSWGIDFPRLVPFDGVVSNEAQRYPGTSLADPNVNFPAEQVNHNNLTYAEPALVEIARAMRSVGMTSR